MVLFSPGSRAEGPVHEKPIEPGTIAVEAHYGLKYNGLKVGHLDMTSRVDAKTYTLSGTGAVSVLFGAFKWTASSSASGTIDEGRPTPHAFSSEWNSNKKISTVRVAFKDRRATEIAIDPPPKIKPDVVPLMPAHKVGALDPISAMLLVTKADNRPPCDRRLAIFDGQQRFDIVLSFKRLTRLSPQVKGGAPGIAYVCRITYQPVAGHRDNDDTKAYMANHDAELVLRPITGTHLLIPESVTIPTAWGTGSMTMTHVDIIGTSAGKIALTE